MGKKDVRTKNNEQNNQTIVITGLLIFIYVVTIVILNAILIYRGEMRYILRSSQCSIMLTKDSRIFFCKHYTCSNSVAHPSPTNC